MVTEREALRLALEALETVRHKIDSYQVNVCDDVDEAITSIREALAQPEQEPVACEPQYANEDGWCDWVCPKPQGYLMQCCDCGLIHEVDSRVAKYQPRPSEEFEVVDDPDLQVQWRMKRRDDISPKRKPLTDEEIETYRYMIDWTASWSYINFARAIEAAHGIKGEA